MNYLKIRALALIALCTLITTGQMAEAFYPMPPLINLLALCTKAKNHCLSMCSQLQIWLKIKTTASKEATKAEDYVSIYAKLQNWLRANALAKYHEAQSPQGPDILHKDALKLLPANPANPEEDPSGKELPTPARIVDGYQAGQLSS